MVNILNIPKRLILCIYQSHNLWIADNMFAFPCCFTTD